MGEASYVPRVPNNLKLEKKLWRHSAASFDQQANCDGVPTLCIILLHQKQRPCMLVESHHVSIVCAIREASM